MSRIAIVGIACRYPDADSPQELWDNAVAGRRAFRRLPDVRMNLDDYWDADPSTPDTFYARNAAVIEKSNGDSVGIGSKVVIKGADGEETFTIVGSAEAAPRDGRISNESPVGAALMGRKKGDKVTVNAPAGPIEYTLVRIG